MVADGPLGCSKGPRENCHQEIGVAKWRCCRPTFLTFKQWKWRPWQLVKLECLSIEIIVEKRGEMSQSSSPTTIGVLGGSRRFRNRGRQWQSPMIKSRGSGKRKKIQRNGRKFVNFLLFGIKFTNFLLFGIKLNKIHELSSFWQKVQSKSRKFKKEESWNSSLRGTSCRDFTYIPYSTLVRRCFSMEGLVVVLVAQW